MVSIQMSGRGMTVTLRVNGATWLDDAHTLAKLADHAERFEALDDTGAAWSFDPLARMLRAPVAPRFAAATVRPGKLAVGA